MWKVNPARSWRQKLTLGAEFPNSSRLGETVAKPIRFGTIARRAPATPDYAGTTSRKNALALSCIPAICFIDRFFLTVFVVKNLFPRNWATASIC